MLTFLKEKGNTKKEKEQHPKLKPVKPLENNQKGKMKSNKNLLKTDETDRMTFPKLKSDNIPTINWAGPCPWLGTLVDKWK